MAIDKPGERPSKGADVPEVPEAPPARPGPDVPATGLEPSPTPSQMLVVDRQAQCAPPPSLFRDVEERRLLNPSQMLSRPNLLTRLFSHVMFKRVAFDDKHVATIRDAEREGNVVFAMNHHSLLDYLYFNYAFKRIGLPLVFFANEIAMTAFRPLWQLAGRGLRRLFGRLSRRLQDTELLAYGLERKRPALVFLKRSSLWPWATSGSADKYLKTVLTAQLDRIHACEGTGRQPMPIRVIPQLLIWSQDPDRYGRRLRDLVFGNPEAPSPLRKVISFVLNRRRAFVQVGKPIDLVEFLGAQPPGTNLDELARKLRFVIRQALTLEERVIKGPILKDAKRIREEILRTREMQAAIQHIAKDTGRTVEQTEKEIGGYLKEMAADFSISYIEFMCMMLTVIFDRIYSEVVPDLQGIDKVREAARKAPLILLPCHRSHVDYLVISYLFYANGLIPPHIAAGNNLNFFPMGHIFRRSGAFFIRRTFKGNQGYTVAFREYLRKLIKEGYWIEFFIEGGRSRTGKMLPPKYGMLDSIIEAVQSGAAPDVYLAPVYLGYEQIIEERAYTQELSGAEKKKENITSLLKTTKVLWSRYGRLYVNFAEPMSIRELLDQAGLLAEDHGLPEGEAHDQFVRRTAYRVLAGINDVAMVTPTAATAMALLMHPKRGVSRQVLLARVGFILEVASRKQAPLSKTLIHALKIRRQEVAAAVEALEAEGRRHLTLALGEASQVAAARGQAVVEAVDEALSRFIQQKHIERHVFDDEVVYTPVPDQRINLDFYKNNIVHLFTAESIFAAAYFGVAKREAATVGRVREAARFLSRTFKHEFVYNPDRPFDVQFEATLDEFVASGFLTVDEVAEGEASSMTGDEAILRVTEVAETTMRLLHQVLEPWLEAYWLLAVGLEQHLLQTMPEKEFVKRVQRMARRLYQEGDISCPEASSSVTFSHAINAYEEMGLVKRSRKGRDKLLSLDAPSAEHPETIPALADRLRDFFSY